MSKHNSRDSKLRIISYFWLTVPMGACGWWSYIWWRLCVSEVISGSAHFWWLSPDHSIKNWPVQPVFSPVVVQPLLARQMILRRRFALIRDQFLGPPTTVPSLDLDTAQLIHSLSFVFIILTAYLFAIVSWPFVCTTEVVGAISSYWERRKGIEQAAEQTELGTRCERNDIIGSQDSVRSEWQGDKADEILVDAHRLRWLGE